MFLLSTRENFENARARARAQARCDRMNDARRVLAILIPRAKCPYSTVSYSRGSSVAILKLGESLEALVIETLLSTVRF